MSAQRPSADVPSNDAAATLPEQLTRTINIVREFLDQVGQLGLKKVSGKCPVVKVVQEDVFPLQTLRAVAMREVRALDDLLPPLCGGILGPRVLRSDLHNAIKLIRRGLGELRIDPPARRAEITLDELEQRMRRRLKSGKPASEDLTLIRTRYGTIHNPEQLKLIERAVKCLEDAARDVDQARRVGAKQRKRGRRADTDPEGDATLSDARRSTETATAAPADTPDIPQAEESTPIESKQKGGRKKEYDEAKDARIVAAWQSRKYPDKPACAKSLEISEHDLEKAIDRQRKREKRSRNN